ncbi:PREDICTED: ATP-binding cassette sub-family A member 3 [Bactrocera latifrons]|uniref:ATP-binding cassette sub-family A member 3 n=1 Tax=Bactrocera latifrons TaxID=174628 RepID=UPI0008DDCFFC|nr:PREDICTED: ATP-binding cassette sub-family A member 3 [Bactrocera latifrons]XP_018787319.1 PREDICTED: ATP-binding cassette sub-family A member 3 [Bactrocera latifrons]XP_018787320.1 PREDICTED: ATP-binding cassette sub-family A member 3 [Bactrocera latifrons]XP_018787321.1 PREDICTED: ATP-binding cassette sub-family A member 3 [Bactrocera latifrons]
MDASSSNAKVTNWEKFKLLLWKNWTLQWNHKLELSIELVLPAVFSLLLVLVRVLVEVDTMGVTTYPPLNISNLDLFKEELANARRVKKLMGLFKGDSDAFGRVNTITYKLAFSPNNTFLEAIITEAAESLNLEGYVVYPNASALETSFTTNNYLAGVQFDDSLRNITDYPRNFQFSLRFPSELRTATRTLGWTWLTSKLFPLIDMAGPRNSEDNDGGLPVGYLREGFLPVQQALSMAYLKLAGNKETLPYIEMQRYPYPDYISDPLIQALETILSLIVVLSFIYPCTSITKNITVEKERQLKEVMKIMGLDNWLHWTAWFIKSFLMLGISSVLIVVLIKIKWFEGVSVLTFSHWSILLVFLLIYTIASICFCFMMATFFSSASTAAAVTGLVWFVTYLPLSFTVKTYETMSLGSKLGWCLISNTAMGFGFKEILGFEGNGEGLQWGNLFKTVSVDSNITVGAIMLMMLLSSVIYMLICLYVEQIMPGDFGVPKKWNFPFTVSYWCGQKEYVGIEDMSNGSMEFKNPDAFEAEPAGKHVGLQVKNLKKRFGDKYAVKGLSVNMYEDEITVLLGHNGAGKTTTISMLTGMFPPTAGTAIINGSDIRTNIEAARMSLGICPQHNVLFDDLSVANHIVFFSRLKGLRGDEIQEEIDKYLRMIELEDKANVASSKLSGGMKRKLSVCCALCGGTKVVLCDEPSSGMDPAARRQLWDLLQAEKVGRTLLLTTHFMDEADVLGDRIAIMSDGELKCHGTSFFLKKKYGSGYRLICVKREGCDANEVTALLNQYIPGIRPEADIGAELSYQLPDNYSTKFEEMFSELETKSGDLMLGGYGVGITSMEEVFMKVGAENSGNGTKKEQIAIMNGGSGFNDDDIESTNSDSMFSENTRLLKGTDLYLNQWHAMLLKKFLYTFRKKFLFLLQNLLAVFFVIITILISRNSSTFRQLPAIKISLAQYPRTFTVLETTSNIAPGSLEQRIAAEYKTIVNSYGGNHQLQLTGESNFTKYILDLGETEQVRINSRYVAAATVNDSKITAWLNNQPLHTAPLTVNLVHNAMAKVLIGPEASITVYNAPLPFSFETKLAQLNAGTNVGTQLATNVGFCMCFVSAFYILFLIKERETRSKLLQFVGGVRVWTFWLSQMLWDMTTFALTALIVVITLACFQEEGFAYFSDLIRYYFLLIMFGFSVLPFTYLLSFLFSEPATGFSRASTINIFAGVALFIVVVIMSYDVFDTKDVAVGLQWFFRIFPHFSLAMGWNNLYVNWATRNTCNSEVLQVLPDKLRCRLIPKCCTTTPYFAYAEPGILLEIVYLAATTVVFFLIIISREYGIIDELIYMIRKRAFKPPPPPEDGYFDDDVDNEKNRIEKMSTDTLASQNLVLNGVTKYYGNFLAVNQVSLCVQENECFGLLGVNGAGKTSTFKMMTGDERITYGSAYIKGMSLKSEMNQIYQDIGYCPQFDALLDDLTGRETLYIFCLLRGVRRARINRIIEDLAKSFGFKKHLDKPTMTYSGGNKRKLSTAIAVIGSPSVIYLDEPTTGMDPAARRQLWNMVCRIRDSGKSIVLTSHSMEECEALCTRLAIMVNGEFKCIGSTQHLKNKFSKGLILKIKVRRAPEQFRPSIRSSRSGRGDLSPTHMKMQQDIISVKEFVERMFPQAILQEEYQGILTFYIPLSSIKWSSIFGLMEKNRDFLNIEDYSISQTTLEEIFLEFAKYQREDPRTLNIKKKHCAWCPRWQSMRNCITGVDSHKNEYRLQASERELNDLTKGQFRNNVVAV